MSEHCTGTLLRCTYSRGRRSVIFRRYHALFERVGALPRLHRTVRDPVITRSRGLGLVRGTATNRSAYRRLGQFFHLLLRGQHRGFVTFVVRSFLRLCHGGGGVQGNILVATIPLPRDARRRLGRLVLRHCHKHAMRFRGHVSPSVVKNIVLNVNC